MITEKCYDSILASVKHPTVMAKHNIALISDWDVDESPSLKQGIAIVRFKHEILLNCGEETRIFILICGDIETRMTLVPHVAHMIEEEDVRQQLLVSDGPALEKMLELDEVQ